MLKIKTLKLTTEKNIKYELDKVTQPENVFNIMQAIGATEKSQEYMYIIGLDIANNVTCIANIGIGGINYASIDPKIVFQYLYLSNSTKFILAHNHPSGSLKPSNEDIQVTKHINEIAKILTFELLDHIIVTPISYTSLKTKQLF